MLHSVGAKGCQPSPPTPSDDNDVGVGAVLAEPPDATLADARRRSGTRTPFTRVGDAIGRVALQQPIEGRDHCDRSPDRRSSRNQNPIRQRAVLGCIPPWRLVSILLRLRRSPLDPGAVGSTLRPSKRDTNLLRG